MPHPFAKTSAKRKRFWLPACVCALFAHPVAQAGEACPDTAQEIDTDRPDVTNSAVVVPRGSLQMENGITWTGGPATGLDGPNSRVRLGIAECSELFVDLPDYSSASAGVSGIAPGLKRQIEWLPDGLSASAVAGVLLPSGSERLSGPYIQFPWSLELTENWKVDGMATGSWFPGRTDDLAGEATLSLAREIGSDADIFFEYVGDFRVHEGFRPALNVGGSYRLTRTQQIDVHAGIELRGSAPFFGIGYSFRFDDLF